MHNSYCFYIDPETAAYIKKKNEQKTKGLTAADRSEEEKKSLYQNFGYNTSDAWKTQWKDQVLSSTSKSPFIKPQAKIPTVPFTTEASESILPSNNALTINNVGSWDVDEDLLEERDRKVQRFLKNQETINTLTNSLFENNEPKRDSVTNATESVNTKNNSIQLGRDTDFKIQNGNYQYELDQLDNKTMEVNATADMLHKNADEISPYYKKYASQDALATIQNNPTWWNERAKEYIANTKIYGEEKAMHQFNEAIKEVIAENTGFFEKRWLMLRGGGAMLAGDVVATLGLAWGLGTGIVNTVTGNKRDNMNVWQSFWSDMIDNPVTNVGSDIAQYGTIFNLAEARELGLSDSEIVTPESWGMLNRNTLPTVMQQQGFTAAAILSGAGLSKLGNLIFKGVKKRAIKKAGTEAAKAVAAGTIASEQVTAHSIGLMKKALTKINTRHNYYNLIFVPGVVGTSEGVIEANSTLNEMRESGLKVVNAEYKNAVEQRALEILKEMKKGPGEFGKTYLNVENNPMAIQDAYEQAAKELQPLYDQSLNELEFEAQKAARVNFFNNSIINGVMNATLKATLFDPGVRKSISQTKLLGWTRPKGKLNITTGTDGRINVNATPKNPKLAKFGYALKESFGEGTEEGLQGLSNAWASGRSSFRIEQYLDNLYDPESTVDIGQHFAGAGWAAFNNARKHFLSPENATEIMYGALGSFIGLPGLGSKGHLRAVKLDKEGKPMLQKDENGKVIVDEKTGMPKYQKTFWGRGMNEFGEREGVAESIFRKLPWRFGFSRSLSEYNARQQEMEKLAKTVEEWANRPGNKEKFDAITGSVSALGQRGKAEEHGDEFEVRNAKLQKRVEDAFMLELISGTDFHSSIMKSYTDVATADFRDNDGNMTDIAQTIVKQMRDNIGTKDIVANMSDEKVFEQVKQNAKEQLDFINRVSEKAEEIDKIVGNAPRYVKQALVYGALSSEDFDARGKQMDEQIMEIIGGDKLFNDVTSQLGENVETNESWKKLMEMGFMSVKHAFAKRESLNKENTSLEEDIKTLREQNKKASTNKKNKKQNEKTIENKKKKIENNKEELKTLDGLLENLNEDEEYVVSAKDIMNMNPSTRGVIFRTAKAEEYERAHNMTQEEGDEEDSKPKPVRVNFTPKQLKIINALYNAGVQKDVGFLDLIVDRGRAEDSKNEASIQYVSALTDTKGLTEYASNLEQSRMEMAYNERAKALSEIKDYGEFREAYEIFEKEVGRQAAYSAMIQNASENFIKYVSQQATLDRFGKILQRNEKFKNVSNEEKNLLVNFLGYMYDNNKDVTNPEEAEEAMTEVDGQGYNKFQKWLVENTQNIPYSDVENLRHLYTTLLQVNQEKIEEEQRKKEPIEVDPSTSQTPPVAAPDTATEGTTEDVNTTEDVEVEDSLPDVTDVQTNMDTQGGNPVVTTSEALYNPNMSLDENINNVVRAFSTTSDPDLGRYVKMLCTYIQNKGYSQEQIEFVVQTLAELSSERMFKYSNIVDAIHRKAENVTLPDDLRKILSDSEKSFTEQLKRDKKYNEVLGQKRTDLSHNGIMQLLPTEEINRYPNSPISNFLNEQHKAEEYLQRNEISGKKIYFAVDPGLTHQVEENMKPDFPGKKEYKEANDLPVIVLVEDENGTYTVDGKKYQPIGILPASHRKDMLGSAHSTKLRELYQKQKARLTNNGKTTLTDPILISDEQDNPITTDTKGKKGNTIDSSQDLTVNDSQANVDISQVVLNELTGTQQKQEYETLIKDGDKQKIRDSQQYQDVVDYIIRQLYEREYTNKKGKIVKIPSFPQERHNGKKQPIDFYTKRPAVTEAKDSDRKFSDVCQGGNTEEIVGFNNQTEYFANRIATALINLKKQHPHWQDSADQILAEDGDDALTDRDTFAQKLGEAFNYAYRDLFNILKNDVFTVHVTPREITDSAAPTSYIVELVSENGTTPPIMLAELTSETKASEISAAMIKSVITDPALSKLDIKWQFDHSLLQKLQDDDPKTRDKAAYAIKTFFDDGLFECSNSRVTRQVNTAYIISPFDSTGEIRAESPDNRSVSTTPENANTNPQPTTSQVPQINGSITVDTQTGIPETKPTGVASSAFSEQQQKIEQLHAESERYELSDDGQYYIDKVTGEALGRVTSTMYADSEWNEKRFDSNSVWALPSTSIGNVVDSFVRDFFEGKLADIKNMSDEEIESAYPNASAAKWKNLAAGLIMLKRNLVGQGYNIVPRDVKAVGQKVVVDKQGRTGIIPICGTLDLLAYNDKGEYMVIDIKTIRNPKKLESNKTKWFKQTSTYAELLKNQGINITKVMIMPVQVFYPSAEEFEYRDAGNNVLTILDETIDMSELRTLPLQDLGTPQAINTLSYEKLSEVEKNMVQWDNAEPMDGKGNTSTQTTNEPSGGQYKPSGWDTVIDGTPTVEDQKVYDQALDQLADKEWDELPDDIKERLANIPGSTLENVKEAWKQKFARKMLLDRLKKCC